MSKLRLRGVSKRYGATVALEHGDLDLEAGEVHVLMGANGSGKSTLSKIIAGSVRPDSGIIELDGKPISITNPQAAREFGVAIFYQELSLAAHRTVAENICLSQLPSTAGVFLDRQKMIEIAERRIAPFLDVVGDGFSVNTQVGQLRADQRQLVEIMKTFAQDADILIFDEPTSALDRAQVECFLNLLREQKAAGRCIVFISHRRDEIFDIGDRITIIRDGRTVSTKVLSETNIDEVLIAMVGDGEAVAEQQSQSLPQRTEIGKIKLVVEDITNDSLQKVGFQVSAGEILGLGGLHGHGQSAILRTIFGVLDPGAGKIFLDGAAKDLNSPRAAIRNGIAYISGDRRRDGVITDRSILENVVPVYALKKHLIRASPNTLGEKARVALELLQSKYESLAHSIGSMSGGNQQKVVVARWLMDAPDILLLDDPTKGIDMATKKELFNLIRELAAQGMAIILYSSEDAELLENADRILVLNNGKIVRELKGSERTRYNLYHAAYEAA